MTSEQERDVNQGIVGPGSYVLKTGMQMEAEVSSNNEIKIRDGVLMHQGCAASIKGGKERIVYLNGRTCLYMREYLQKRTDNNPALFVGLRYPHQRLSKEGIEYVIREAGRRAGVEKSHPHRFRRTALTNALNRGMPLQEAMILAGHAKPETTMMYCTVDQESVQYHHKKYLSA